jgi:ADP-heptose:LPS heptosyltransferase
LERYGRLISLIKKHSGLPVLITGGPGEERMGNALLRLLETGAASSLVGRLPLAQSLCLFKRAALMVTSDSGPMHAAAALGTKLVALFGPTLPERTGPRGSNSIIIQPMKSASHHSYRHDPDRIHMKAIEVEPVFEAVMNMLDL